MQNVDAPCHASGQIIKTSSGGSRSFQGFMVRSHYILASCITHPATHVTRHTSLTSHHINNHKPPLNITASSRFKPLPDTDAEGITARLARLVDASHNSEPELKGFLPLGDSSTLVTACSEENPAIWALNIDLQSTMKADLPFRDKTLSSSNVLKLVFYGPHARDSCKIWDAAIHRVAHFASVKWTQWEMKVRFLLIHLGENWSTDAELAAVIQRDGETVVRAFSHAESETPSLLSSSVAFNVSITSICFAMRLLFAHRNCVDRYVAKRSGRVGGHRG
jgi:hypothetical protein